MQDRKAIQPLIGLVSLLLCALATVSAQDPTQVFKLAKLDLNGLQNISREKFMELSGLQIGQSLTIVQLKEAANQASSSGRFDKVGYRYSSVGEQLSVSFDLIERPPAPTTPVEPAAKPKPAEPMKLGKVVFNGLKRCDEATALKVSGLQMGTVFDSKNLTAAAKSLSQTGYFSEITYEYARVDGQAVANFTLVEFDWNILCVFDNFVWFSPKELRDAIRQEIPWYEGIVPENDIMPERIRLILNNLLKQRSLARIANYQVFSGDVTDDDPTKIRKDFLFIATGTPMPICTTAFPGASPAFNKSLQNALKDVPNLDYSNLAFEQFVSNTLLPLYREKGFLRAKFGATEAQPNNLGEKKCASGVNIAVPVEEGKPYKLGKFDWIGSQALASKEMKEIFGMKPGAIADGAKIERGFKALRESYFNQGYLTAKINVETDFDDSTGTANYRILVADGAVYNFDQLVIKNASESEEKRIRSKWQLAQGSPMNVSYVRKYVQKFLEDTRGSGRTPRVQLAPDKSKLTAQVVFTY